MSANLVIAAPYTPDAPDGFTPWVGLKLTWTGWDGSVWDLTDPDGGVFLLADGLEGLYFPDFENYLDESAVVPGVSFQGWLATGRKVFWNIGVFHDDSSAGFVKLNRAFMRTLRPGTTGVWTVEIPVTGERFSLRLRLAAGNAHMFERDPVKHGWDVFGLALFPEQPFWEAAPVEQSWKVGEQLPFFGAAKLGPPFYVSPAATLVKASVTNPGDVETFIRWTVVGPASAASVGVGKTKTDIRFTIPAGSRLVIDTDPRNLTAELDGVDVMDRLPDFAWSALPPGEDVELNLSMNGTGRIEARFTPLYLMGV